MQQLLTGKTRLPGFGGAWEEVALSNVADKRMSFSFVGGPFGSNLKASEYTESGVRIIQLQNIGDGVFHDEYAIYTSEEKANELISCNIYPGEIIISKMGDPVARACLVPGGNTRYLMASDGIRLAVDNRRFNTRYVHDYINYTDFRNKAFEASTGSTRMRIGLSELKRLTIMAPSLPEQAAIAAALSDMDAEIAALEQRRDKTQAIKQGMMQQLLTGRVRLMDNG
jgi:type I restriction enzyme S subunit